MTRKTDREGPEMEVVAAWLDLHKVLWCHCPNEGLRHPRTGARLKRQGMKPGVPDILIFDPPPAGEGRRGVAIELKAPGPPYALPTRYQRDWLAALESRGWSTYVAHGAGRAIEFLRFCGYGG